MHLHSHPIILITLPLVCAVYVDTSAADELRPPMSSGQFRLQPLERQVYAGIGLGRAWLEPDAGDVPGVGPNDRVQLGLQATLGVDFNKWVSAEVHAADLGEAGLSSGDSIGYRQFGTSALIYAGRNRSRYNRRGLTAFGRLGFGYLSNDADSSNRFDFQRENATHALFGLGLEYALRQGLAFRAETVVFDSDANYTQLAMLYRFGSHRDRPTRVSRAKPVRARPKPRVTQVEVEPPVALAALPQPEAAGDGDGDGVADADDRCPGSAATASVDATGCDAMSLAFKQVTFRSGSAELTPSAIAALERVAKTMKRMDNQRFRIESHTDSRGTAVANRDLSRRRAQTVVRFFVDADIDPARFDIRAMGETLPVASNDTAMGRRENRRVELELVR